MDVSTIRAQHGAQDGRAGYSGAGGRSFGLVALGGREQDLAVALDAQHALRGLAAALAAQRLHQLVLRAAPRTTPQSADRQAACLRWHLPASQP